MERERSFGHFCRLFRQSMVFFEARTARRGRALSLFSRFLLITGLAGIDPRLSGMAEAGGKGSTKYGTRQKGAMTQKGRRSAVCSLSLKRLLLALCRRSRDK